MTAVTLYALFVITIAAAGAVCYELTDQATEFWWRVLFRTFSWFWIGVAGILLSGFIKAAGQ